MGWKRWQSIDYWDEDDRVTVSIVTAGTRLVPQRSLEGCKSRVTALEAPDPGLDTDVGTQKGRSRVTHNRLCRKMGAMR